MCSTSTHTPLNLKVFTRVLQELLLQSFLLRKVPYEAVCVISLSSYDITAEFKREFAVQSVRPYTDDGVLVMAAAVLLATPVVLPLICSSTTRYVVTAPRIYEQWKAFLDACRIFLFVLVSNLENLPTRLSAAPARTGHTR